MGYVAPPPPSPFRPNLDRFGLPKDFATYLWATYGPGKDIPPERRAFLYKPQEGTFDHPNFGQQIVWR